MMAHFNLETGLNNLKFSYLRCPTAYAYLEVSMNDDIYWTVTRYPKQIATCLTDHNSAVRALKLLRRSLYQMSRTNLALSSNNLKFSYQVDLQRIHIKRWGRLMTCTMDYTVNW